jgi:hypothetical protein
VPGTGPDVLISITLFIISVWDTISWILEMRSSEKFAELPKITLLVMVRAEAIIYISYFKPNALSITSNILRSL